MANSQKESPPKREGFTYTKSYKELPLHTAFSLYVFVAVVVLHLVNVFLDILLLVAWADKQHVVGINHDIVA